MKRKRVIPAVLAFAFAASGLFGQTATEIVDKARQLYAGGNFRAAFDLVASGISESADSPSRTLASNFMSEMGVAEYNRRNFLNAWEAFRKSLKYSPTNSVAAQYFQRMKKEMDVTKLRNEADEAAAKARAEEEARLKAEAEARAKAEEARLKAEAEARAKAEAEARAKEEEAARIKAAEEERKRLEEEVRRKIEEEARLASAAAAAAAASAASADPGASTGTTTTGTATTGGTTTGGTATSVTATAGTLAPSTSVTTAEIEALRRKVAAAESLIASMRAAPQASGEGVDSAFLEELERQRVANAEALRVLTDVVDRQMEAAERAGSALQGQLSLVLLGIAVIGLALGVVAVVVVVASRRRRPATEAANAVPGLGQDGSMKALADSRPALLEFSATVPISAGRGGEADLRRQLIRAERLSRMYEDAKNGNLSWETVRAYADELESALKVSILSLVEEKLDDGEPETDAAALKVLFPFMVDYDDYVRGRADKAATLAIKGLGSVQEAGPFSVESLVPVAERIGRLLHGKEQCLLTARLTRSIARALGLSASETRDAYKAALVHDAGYLTLDENRLRRILSAPDLRPDDFAFVKSHVLAGPSYFGEAEIPGIIKDGMLYHHERNDGSGYPGGRKKDSIPLVARIIGAAESYAALLGARPYRDKADSVGALAIIRDARTKFDREIVDALASLVTGGGRHA